MKEHPFLLEPKQWLGEGKINLSMVEEELDFMTRWSLGERDCQGLISAEQEVQIKGMNDTVYNQFIITEITGLTFNIELKNASLGIIVGKGFIKEDLIAWEFRNNDLEFEGFEFYEKQKDGTYLMRSEYVSSDQYRTTIRGKIWEKLPEGV